MLRRLVVAGSTVAASLVLAGTAAAQTGVLTGTVIGTAGRTPLVGATVTIVGTSLSAVTDSSGRFTIANVPAGDVELRVRRVEFFPLADRVRVAAGDTTRAEYQLLHPDDERRERRELPVPTMSGTPDSTTISFSVRERPSGAEGERTIIVDRLRTGTEPGPMIIVDGVIMSPSYTTSDIDGSRIESVEVIKGEAAKDLYGTRASQGVISIKTKPVPPPPPKPPIEELKRNPAKYYRFF